MNWRVSIVAAAGTFSVLAGIATAQVSSGVMQASQAMDALNRGDYSAAISGFTAALKTRDLSPSDTQMAHAARGFAYLQSRDYWSAIDDLDLARRSKPDDADSQMRLAAAIAAVQPASMIPGQSAKRLWSGVGKAVLKGALEGIAQGLAQQQQ
jgi:Flp pilus assembly protein TadD